MEGTTNNHWGPFTTDITGDCQTLPVSIETVSRLLFSSDYYRKVDRTTDIAGRLPNAVYTLPPRLVQAIVGRAEVTDTTRKALVAVCKKFYLANRQYERCKEVFVDKHGDRSTTITLDCGHLYSEGCNYHGQCGTGSVESKVTGPCLIRLPPVLQVWHDDGSWFANTARGLFAWGWNPFGKLGLGKRRYVRHPCRLMMDDDVLEVCMVAESARLRTVSGWLGCGPNRYGQLGIGHTDEVTTPNPIPGSEGVTRWAGNHGTTFGLSDNGLLACGENDDGQCGVKATNVDITTLTPVALPDDVKGRVDRVVFGDWASFFITDRRCFGCGSNGEGQLGLGHTNYVNAPTELPIPVNDIIAYCSLTVIRSGDTLLACGSNLYRRIFSNDTPKLTTPTPLNLPGPVVKVFLGRLSVFVQLADGAWVGRGRNNSNYFTPVPKTDLIDGDLLPGWTPAMGEYADSLNTHGLGGRALVLPEPIANS